MVAVLTYLQRLKDSCLDALSSRFACWTKPLTSSLPLQTLADLGRSRSELVAENVLLRKPLIILHMKTIRTYQPRGQAWSTFLRNHAAQIWACDFIQVTDLFFRPLFAFFLIELKSRKVIQVGVTRSPTDAWVATTSGIELLKTPYHAPRAAEGVPATRRRKKRSRFDASAPYVLKRGPEGCHDAKQIWQELRAQGYRDSLRMVYYFLAPLRKGFYIAEQTSKISRQAVWLLIRKPTDLNETEQEQLRILCQVNDTISAVYHFTQDLLQMVRKLQGDALDAWLERIKTSQIPELQGFAQGIGRDKGAVQAGLTLPYSNGVVEGHVNRLKLIKRMMYGRAAFPLRGLRVLQSA